MLTCGYLVTLISKLSYSVRMWSSGASKVDTSFVGEMEALRDGCRMVRHGISQGRLHGAQRAEAAHACPELWAKIPSKAQLLNAPPHCPSPVRSELFRQCYAVGAGVLVRENGCRGRGHRDPLRLRGKSVVGCGRCKVSRYYANAFMRPFVIHGAATAVKNSVLCFTVC